MARPRKKAEQKSSSLLQALEFVGMACREKGPINETHMYMCGNWVAASNGVITIASKIEENLFACPQSKMIINALSKCGQTYEIVGNSQPANSLAIKAGKFKAVIPCVDPVLLFIPSPDSPIADINDNFKIGLQILDPLVNDKAQGIIGASIFMNGKSLIASDRVMIIEHWHGIDLPKGLTLPQAVIEPIVKSNKKLSKFGFSQSSITFYFEDQSWIKTQLYVEKWPDMVADLLNRPSRQQPFPKDFWEALAAIAPFATNGVVWFGPGCLCSEAETGVGATFDIEGLPKGPSFQARHLGLLKGLAATVDWTTPGVLEGTTWLTFFDDKGTVRGAIAGRTQ
jgi:hypothetical protein